MHSKMPWISLHETFAFGLARVYYSAMGISRWASSRISTICAYVKATQLVATCN